MALVGFPNQIEVTIGHGWIAGLVSPDEVIVLTRIAGTDNWSEDGTDVGSATNRLLITFAGVAYGKSTFVKAVYSTSFMTAGLAFVNRAPTSVYNFLSLWSNSSGASNVWVSMFFSASQTYNPDVFSLIREYIPPSTGAKPIVSGGSVEVYSSGRASVFGGQVFIK